MIFPTVIKFTNFDFETKKLITTTIEIVTSVLLLLNDRHLNFWNIHKPTNEVVEVPANMKIVSNGNTSIDVFVQKTTSN
ncbi:CLUMA_CG017136, isoform A [Clunio marinus]|uniref:CLUMA_CG017136, isoform A n=1 Tax=Clunio marinus TaxID=568069 RepID=A0A1J1IWE0_9DIPT|nr:CLUMA_CG017136, isoform A [Clunio marinus]